MSTMIDHSRRLSREELMAALDFFSKRVKDEFRRPIRLVAHGGACMILHDILKDEALRCRRTTRDIDIILRGFVAEYSAIGFLDPEERLKRCIDATAKEMGLVADWMNWDADTALPMALHPKTLAKYDPIYNDAIQPNNIDIHTIYTSPNGMVTLISVAPFWAVALKLQRYSLSDAADICAILRDGTNRTKIEWTPERLSQWVQSLCWPMGYVKMPPAHMIDWKNKIADVIQKFHSTPPPFPAPPSTSHPIGAPSHATFTAIPNPFTSEAIHLTSDYALRHRSGDKSQHVLDLVPPVSNAGTNAHPRPSDGYRAQHKSEYAKSSRARHRSRRGPVRPRSSSLSSSEEDTDSDDSSSDDGLPRRMRMSAIYANTGPPSGSSHFFATSPPPISRHASQPVEHADYIYRHASDVHQNHLDHAHHRTQSQSHVHIPSTSQPLTSVFPAQSNPAHVNAGHAPRSSPSPRTIANNNNLQRNWSHISQALPHVMSLS